MQQTVALDYDGTTSVDYNKWIYIADILHAYGDKVICVCSRRNTPENLSELKRVFPYHVDIIFTNHNPKKAFVEKRGIKVDVWIDNDPSSLFQSDNLEKQIPDE